MSKTFDEAFRDWEGEVFGFGYGTGEHHVIPALKTFLAEIPSEGAYDYVALEAAVGATVAWLLINILAHADMINYGSSPRFGWLTEQGRMLREYTKTKTAEELIDATDVDESYAHCYSNCCNCKDGSHTKGCRHNPFWVAR